MEIKLTYRPWFMPVPLKFKRNVATCWKEASRRELMAIVKQLANNEADDDYLANYTGIPLQIISKLDKFCKYQLIVQTQEIHKSNFDGRFLIPSIKYGEEYLMAPRPMLGNICFGQFIYADAFLHNIENNESAALNLVATLYLPENEEFDNAVCLERAKHLKINETTIAAIVMNYQLFYPWLAQAYPLLFSVAEPNEDATDKGEYDPRGWIKIAESVIGDDLINEQKYYKTNVNSVFRFVSGLIKKAAKRK